MKPWLLLLLAACVRAWDISCVDVSRPDVPAGPNEDLVKTWTIAGDHPLRYLHLHLPGRVFVDVETAEPLPTLAPSNGSASVDEDQDEADRGRAVQAVAKVVLSGTSEEVLNQLEVVSAKKDRHDGDGEEDEEDDDGANWFDHRHAHEAIKVHYKNERFDGTGYVLVRVVLLQKQALAAVDMSASADVVIGPDALVQNDPAKHVALRSHGSGDLFLPTPTQTFSIGSLAVVVAGSSSFQIQAKSLTVRGRLAIQVSGSGTVAVVADAVNVGDTLTTTVAGSGTAVVQAAQVVLQNLTTDVAGSGDVSYSRTGSCLHQEVAVAGSGTVMAGSLVCTDTQVDVIGSGNVVVQTSHCLHTSSVLSGAIHYFGPAPKEIVSEGEFLLGGDPKGTVKPTTVNKVREAELSAVPKREPVHVVLHFRRAWFGSDPHSHSWFTGGNRKMGDNMVLTTWLQQQQREQDGVRSIVVAVVSVAMVCGLVTLAVKAYQAHARRHYVLMV